MVLSEIPNTMGLQLEIGDMVILGIESSFLGAGNGAELNAFFPRRKECM